MKIYKCLLTGDEILWDNGLPLAEEEDIVYVVEGKYKEEGAKVFDVVEENRLQEVFLDKTSYHQHIVGYLREIKSRLEATQPDRVQPFMTGAQSFVKKVASSFDEWQFFTGESQSLEGMLVLARHEGDRARFYFFKDGLCGEKV